MERSKRNQFPRLLVLLMVTMMTFTSSRAQEIYRMESNPAAVQLRTNGLYWLALCPNIGLEIQTDLGLAFQLDYVGAWWNRPSKNRFYSNYGFQTEVRYYLGSRQKEMPYTGHHLGAYYQMLTYDFEFGGTGYQSRDLDMTMGGGLSYGYSFPLSRRWSLDFTLGLGYFSSKYLVYEPAPNWEPVPYAPTNYKRLTFFGPTKVEATLVWNINRKNDK